MDWLRKQLLNPNVHGLVTLALGIAATIPGPWQAISAILTPVFAGITTVLPENGSLHKTDYENIAGLVADAVSKAVDKPGRA